VSGERVPAVETGRTVPAPDPIARDYLLLALRLGKLIPGLVDWYYGPEAIRREVDHEPPPDAATLRRDASALLSRLREPAGDELRQHWLQAQLVALEAHAMSLAGDPLPYTDFVACCFDLFPERVPDAAFANAADDLSRLLPPDATGQAGVAERLNAWQHRFEIDPQKLPVVGAWLARRFRARTAELLGLPEGEQADIHFEPGVVWRSSNRYDGLRSRVTFDTQAPYTIGELVGHMAHETYPGHHTETVWRDRLLVEELERVEVTVSVVNTPARMISEGLAEQGERFVAPDHELADLLVELYGRAGLPIASDPIAARDAADRQVRIRRALSVVKAVTGNAAYMLHVEGAPREEVEAFLRRYMVTTPERAALRVAFIEHPLWRVYAFASYEGSRLLRRWFDMVSPAETAARYRRLLHDQLTPGDIADELALESPDPEARTW
jgi:hypothetical protein